MPAIETQFWTGLKQREAPHLSLDVEIVDKFPEDIYKNAEELECWAFVHGEEFPTVVGFTNVRVKVCAYRIYATVAELGGLKELLIHDGCRAFKMFPSRAASILSFSLNILHDEFPSRLFDNRALQSVIDEAAARGT